MTDDQQQPAGWYPTPGGQQRYWDGHEWTEHTAPGQQSPPVTCPTCRGEVPAGAQVCMHCRRPVPGTGMAKERRQQQWLIAAALTVVLVLGGWWFMANQVDNSREKARSDLCEDIPGAFEDC